MKQKLLVTRQLFPEVLDFLRVDFDVDDNQADEQFDRDTLIERLRDKDGVLAMITERIDTVVLAEAARLAMVANCAVGTDNIDVAACTARGILVSNTPGVLTETVADHAFALLLAAARRLCAVDRWIRDRQWNRWSFTGWLGTEVHGATIGICGMGAIGQAIARRARGFDMRVFYHCRHRLDAAVERACGAEWQSKDELLAGADFIVLALPYSADTRHFIGAREIALMKPSAQLVNVARGGVVDDEALIAALRRGAIAGAALDVFENEPELDENFLGLSEVVLSPHIGSASRTTRLSMAMLAAENLKRGLLSGDPPNLVNPLARRQAR